jgi:acyl dehydratase
VTTTDYGSIYRGVATDGEVRVVVESLPVPEAPVGGEPRWVASVPVAARAAHVYSECARIWNPIHTDVAVARAAGLPDPILHGSATLALAVSEVIQRDLAGDPARVRGIAVRFTGMVPMPSAFRVRGRGRGDGVLGFDAVDERGQLVLSDGVVRV